MSTSLWPDPLRRPDPAEVQAQLARFWRDLAGLADLLANGELLLAAAAIGPLRELVMTLMLALNGIARPVGTRRLNGYLGASQRAALEKTLALPRVSAQGIMGQAVALVVIYRWYAPQLVAALGCAYPTDQEAEAWATLTAALPDWPLTVATE
jgi:hypothetical protein